MGAMHEFLRRLETPELRKVYENLDELWDNRSRRLNHCLAEEGLPVRVASLTCPRQRAWSRRVTSPLMEKPSETSCLQRSRACQTSKKAPPNNTFATTNRLRWVSYLSASLHGCKLDGVSLELTTANFSTSCRANPPVSVWMPDRGIASFRGGSAGLFYRAATLWRSAMVPA
jgi:hypothetical protein